MADQSNSVNENVNSQTVSVSRHVSANRARLTLSIPANHYRYRESDNEILRKFYCERDYLLSGEGILKVLSVITCIVSSVLYLSGVGGSCIGAPRLVASAASVGLITAALMALLYAGAALGVPAYAPATWLHADVLISTVMGVLLLVTAILSMTSCQLSDFVDYLYGPLGIVNAVMVTGSGALAYVSAMEWRDAAHAPPPPPTPSPRSIEELDV